MLRKPDTPLMPATAHRLAMLGSLTATICLFFSMSDTDQYGRDHVFSGLHRGVGKWISLEKGGIRFGRRIEEGSQDINQGIDKQES